jgi:hypothetical protein
LRQSVSDAQEPSSTPGASHPLVGEVVGERYRIEALLGEGGMGAVFRARHLSLDRPVALKVLHPRLVEDAQVQQRFEREALAISKLDHPNCVRVMDFGTTPAGMKYLVMPFLEGQELRELTGVALPTEQVVELGVQILQALDHAHKRGLVHRDLKPENIFLVRDDDDRHVVKLVDFGIVKLLESEGLAKLTRAGMAFGTPTYMSPEQAAGGKIDERTDLYSVGVILYELLTGVPPFTADEPAILMRMQILTDPPPLPETVPRPLADVVLKLLGKEPHERYATARDARRALVAAAAGEVAPSASSSSGEVPSPIVADAPAEPATMLDAPAAAAPAVVAAPAAAAPAPVATGPEASASALLVSSGSTVLASASMSHGVAPASAGIAPFAPLPVHSGPVPVSAPLGGPSPHSGSYGLAPAPRRDAGWRGVYFLLILLGISFTVWAVLAWAWTRDDPTDAASSKPSGPTQATTPARKSAGETPAVVAKPASAGKKAAPATDEQLEERRRAVAKRREEQKRVAEKWREEQRRAAAKRR